MNQTDPEDAAVERQLPLPRWKQNVWPNGILEDVVQLTDRSVTVTVVAELAQPAPAYVQAFVPPLVGVIGWA
jgi:hypothetical protein